MPSLGSLHTAVAPVRIELRGAPAVKVQYRISAFTDAFLANHQERWDAAQTDSDLVGVYAHSLAEVLTGWDLTDDEAGQVPTPLTEASLRGLGLGICVELYSQLLKDIFPNRRSVVG